MYLFDFAGMTTVYRFHLCRTTAPLRHVAHFALYVPCEERRYSSSVVSSVVAASSFGTSRGADHVDFSTLIGSAASVAGPACCSVTFVGITHFLPSQVPP